MRYRTVFSIGEMDVQYSLNVALDTAKMQIDMAVSDGNVQIHAAVSDGNEGGGIYRVRARILYNKELIWEQGRASG